VIAVGLVNGSDDFPVRHPATASRDSRPDPPEDFVGLKAGADSVVRSAQNLEVAFFPFPRGREYGKGMVESIKGAHVPPLLSELQVRPQSNAKARA